MREVVYIVSAEAIVLSCKIPQVYSKHCGTEQWDSYTYTTYM